VPFYLHKKLSSPISISNRILSFSSQTNTSKDMTSEAHTIPFPTSTQTNQAAHSTSSLNSKIYIDLTLEDDLETSPTAAHPTRPRTANNEPRQQQRLSHVQRSLRRRRKEYKRRLGPILETIGVGLDNEHWNQVSARVLSISRTLLQQTRQSFFYRSMTQETMYSMTVSDRYKLGYYGKRGEKIM
jgi:hypothetical protein